MLNFSKTTILLAFAVILSFGAISQSHAHSAGVATYIIKQNAQKNWKLTISVPLGGLHQALLNHHSESDLWDENKKYNSKLATDYLMSHSNIEVNGVRLSLISQRTTLSDHQSDFVFSIVNMPSPPLSIDFALTAMSENPGHINIARIKTRYVNKKLILQAYNKFEGQLIL